VGLRRHWQRPVRRTGHNLVSPDGRRGSTPDERRRNGAPGIFDQSLAALNDASGLTLTGYTSAFANFDPAAFDTAVSSLLDPTAFTLH
jgi:hypothetical protein